VAARAQPAFQIETHSIPTGPDDGVFLQQPATLRGRTVSVQLRLDYTNQPLVVGLRGATVTEFSVLAHRLTGALSVVYGLADRVSVYLTLPAVLHQRGDTVPGLDEPASGGFGDAAVGVNAHLVGGSEGAQLGLGLALIQPTGSQQAFASDDRIGGVVQLRFAYVARRWSLGATSGVSLRPDRDWLTHRTGTDLTLTLGGFVFPTEAFRLGVELAAATGLTEGAFLESDRTPLELNASGRVTIGDQFFLQASAGVGFIHGVGNPRVRATLALGVATSREP
jgi:hypothetical protein